MTSEINLQSQLNSDGSLNYITYRYKGSTVKIGFGYDANGKMNKILIPPFLNLKHKEVFDIVNRFYIERINTIQLIKLIDKITLVDTIAAITNIANINSVDLIDRITLLDRITLIDTISAITNIANIANLQSVDLIDRISLIDEITKIDAITEITTITNPVNVKTSGGTNIVLDALTQGAYTERRSTISNSGAVLSWDYATGNNRQGKLFPRGCRGFIYTIDVYCKDDAATGGTMTAYIAPVIGMGAVASATLTIPAGGAAAWRSATFNLPWNYDSLFIWVTSSTTNMLYAYDADIPFDHFASADAGVTWTHTDHRLHFRAILKGETVGDVPVSGIVNTIEIPNVASTSTAQVLAVPASSGLYSTPVYGSGKLLWAIWYTTDDPTKLAPNVVVDGVMIPASAYTFTQLNEQLISASSPGFAIGVWDTVGPYYSVVMTLPIPFKRRFEIGFQNGDAGNVRTGTVMYLIEKIS